MSGATEDDLAQLAVRLGAACVARGILVAAAESCTGGLIAGALTGVSGSSAWFAGGVVAYANAVKQGLLAVDAAMLEQWGAVSEPVVEAMAVGVARAVGAQATVAVSGVAGPTGGTPEKPVGTVCMAWLAHGRVSTATHHFSGDRAAVRRQTVAAAIAGLLARVEAASS
ncbi:MAG: CinA family protein [Desulfovibrionaceae bacterium]